MVNKIICLINGHKIGKVGEPVHTLPNGRKLQGIEFGCVRCGKRYKDDEPISVSNDNWLQKIIRNRK